MRISKLHKYLFKSSQPQQLWAPLSTCLELWKRMMIHNARNVYQKTSKSFQMPISSVAVNGNHRGGDKVWKTKKTRANCLLDSYKSQLKPQFNHRRPPRRFGRLWNWPGPHQQKYGRVIRRQKSSLNSVSEVWKRTSDKDGAFWEANIRLSVKNVEVEENGFHKWVKTPNRPQNPPEPPQEAIAEGFTMALTPLTMDRPQVQAGWPRNLTEMEDFGGENEEISTGYNININRNWMTLCSYKKPLQPNGQRGHSSLLGKMKKLYTF